MSGRVGRLDVSQTMLQTLRSEARRREGARHAERGCAQIPSNRSIPAKNPSAQPHGRNAAGAGRGSRNQQPASSTQQRVSSIPASAELLTLKLRYKAPDGDTSQLLEFPLTDAGTSYERSSKDFRFAAAVASFGMLLRDSPHKGKTNWDSTLELATEGKGEDRNGYRAEFVGLIERAKAASRARP